MRQPLLSDSFCCCSSSSSSKSDSFTKTTKVFASNKKQFSNFNSPKITSNNYFAIKNSNFLILFKFYNLLTFLSILCCVSSFSLSPSSNNLLTTTQPRPSCREHLLNGNSENKIFPLLRLGILKKIFIKKLAKNIYYSQIKILMKFYIHLHILHPFMFNKL
ncbi:unnamed protein product [Meloidogyne enterolobii]|uniref:Uncharacterized protein n=1 Tax=Meloidogyne enterolobii TaxID=390850 RepID=A0ACB0YMM1_MELEN